MSGQPTGPGSIVQAITACHPQAVSTFQEAPTVEVLDLLAASVRAGTVRACSLWTADTPREALSNALLAAALGARTYTAMTVEGLRRTSGLLADAVALRLPIVMTVLDRGEQAGDRDHGWVHLHADSLQGAVDLHVQAFRAAAEFALPVMVWLHEHTLATPGTTVVVPTRPQAARYLLPEVPGPARTRAALDDTQVLRRIPLLGDEYTRAFGRPGVTLLAPGHQDADTVVVALSSRLDRIRPVVDDLRAGGLSIGTLGVTTHRPFPAVALRAALGAARRVVVPDTAVLADVEQTVPDTGVITLPTAHDAPLSRVLRAAVDAVGAS